MQNPITAALGGLSVDQETQLYLKIGQAAVTDLRMAEASRLEAVNQRREHKPGIRREAITRCHRALFDACLAEVNNSPPTTIHNPSIPPENFHAEMINSAPYHEYMQEVAALP